MLSLSFSNIYMLLQNFNSGNLELTINTETGEAYASQSSLARMCNVSETAIRKWVASNQIAVLEAEINTGSGIQGSNLLDENAIYVALSKYKPTLLIQCAKAGLRIYLHGLAGYRYQVVEQTKPSPQDFDKEERARLLDYLEISERLAKLENPLIRSYMEQTVMERLSVALPGKMEAALTGEKDAEDLVICSVVAADLGYTLRKGEDSTLGKYVKKRHNEVGKAQHGKYMVNVFRRADITDTIQEYIDLKTR